MLDFVAETSLHARGSTITVSSSTWARAAGQTIFHLHWHVLGGGLTGRMT